MSEDPKTEPIVQTDNRAREQDGDQLPADIASDPDAELPDA